MELLENLQKLKRQLGRAEFEKKFPHPWLVRELDDDERPALFRTMVTNVKKIAPPAPLPKQRLAGMGMSAQLAAEPGRYGVYPLAKSGSNPWSDRILVGRASNNDVVIKNDRISKLHAYFQSGPRGWRVYDARSANGTRVDGVLVPPGEEGLEVKSGQVVMFGTVAAQVFDSAELYEAL
jgi:pSer/pThr/pTyr-binding forkhead associated (FHA) protein